MKKIFIVAASALTLFSAVGCQDFLDVKTEGNMTSDNFLSNDQQAVDVIDRLPTYYDDEDMYSQNLHWDMCTGNMLVAAREGDASSWFNNFRLNYSGDAARMPAMYEGFYAQIARANWAVQLFLNKKEKTELSYVEKRSLGEAYFYRAFAHLLVAYRYGCKELGVPFCAYETYKGGYDYSIPPQQESVMKNYELIVTDFQAAYDLLPKISEYSDNELGRPQKEACLAMMVRAYAYWATFDKNKWSDVKTTVDKLEAMGRDLAPTYDVLFTDEPTEFFSKEYCWGIVGLGKGSNGAGVWFEEVCIPSQISPEIDGWGEFNTSYDMYLDYMKDGEDNIRYTTSVTPVGSTIQLFGRSTTIEPYYGDQSQSGYMIYKWCKAISHPDGQFKYWSNCRTNNMFHIMRFADCLLLRAEANLVQKDPAQAAVDINKVRKRSNLKPLAGSATWADIYHERRCELAFEGMDYMFDLKRWAYSGDSDIKALAIKELEGHAQAGIFVSDGKGGYVFDHAEDYALYRGEAQWADYKVCFPYPSTELVKSNGLLKQNPGY